MVIIDNILKTPLPPLTATIGFFDGVHTGHRALIEEVVRNARMRDEHSAVITFSQHPRAVLNSSYIPALLSTLDEKLRLIEESGADYCILLPFTPALASLTAQEFMERILLKQYNVKTLLVGYDHRFGRRNDGESFADYCNYGKACGMEVLQACAFRTGGVTVSSSSVRRLVSGGEMEKAAYLLGYPYTLQGEVVRGQQIGRNMGFPTANIACSPLKLLPADGVYAATVNIKGNLYKGMLNIGCRPTLGEEKPHRTVEVHILHLQENLYGKVLVLSVLKRIREEQKFDTLQELMLQLQADAVKIEKLKL